MSIHAIGVVIANRSALAWSYPAVECYEVFERNRRDSTTVEEIVTTMESRYGKSNRVRVMDCGMLSEANIKFLNDGD